jgi:F-type H+-transporting ATPase subunit a
MCHGPTLDQRQADRPADVRRRPHGGGVVKRLLSPKVLIGLVVVVAAMIYARMTMPVDLLHIQLPPEAIPGWHIGPLAITNTMIAIVQAELVVLFIGFLAVRNMQLVPTGLQNFVEAIVEFWESTSIQMVGERLTRQYMPLVLTIFLLVWAVNWSEMVPGYDSVGIAFEAEHGPEETVAETEAGAEEPADEAAAAEHAEAGPEHTLFEVERHVGGVALLGGRADPDDHGEGEAVEAVAFAPFFRVASSDLNFTLALALIAFTTIQLAGFRELGGGYLGKFFNFKEGPLGIFVGLLELVSELSRIISYAFRLFGNLFAGQVLLFVIPFLLPLFAPVPVFGLELFVGLIQAYVFAILTLAFVSQAIISHDHH